MLLVGVLASSRNPPLCVERGSRAKKTVRRRDGNRSCRWRARFLWSMLIVRKRTDAWIPQKQSRHIPGQTLGRVTVRLRNCLQICAHQELYP